MSGWKYVFRLERVNKISWFRLHPASFELGTTTSEMVNKISYVNIIISNTDTFRAVSWNNMLTCLKYGWCGV